MNLVNSARAKCNNFECQSKNECLRYMAPTAQFGQLLMQFKPAPGEIACDEFIRYEDLTSEARR